MARSRSRSWTRKSPRMSRCGRGCRRPNFDEMVHAFPEKLSGCTQEKRRAA